MKVKLITISFIGAGESGKSTILKQMRLIYTKDGFTKNEKEEWRVIIFNNILDGLRMSIEAMAEYGIEFEYENTSVCFQWTLGYGKVGSSALANDALSRSTYLP